MFNTFEIQVNNNGIWTTISRTGNFGLQREVDSMAQQLDRPVRAVDNSGSIMALAMGRNNY